MMKVAIRSAVLAVLPVIICAADFVPQKPADAAAQQQQQEAPHAAPETDPAKLAQPAAKTAVVNSDPSYVIGPEDVLGIQVWGDTRLSGSFLVRPDGRISVALIGEVNASGLTPSELENAIGEVLKQKEILRKPQVTVQVTQINSKKYFIQGEVLKPGPNPLVVPTTVLEALVNAGGFKDFANVKRIEVIRGKDRFKFNYKDVIHGKHTEQNILLKPGDIIIVP